MREDSTHGHHQMVNTKIRLIIFFAAKHGDTLYTQQKTRPGADYASDHELLMIKSRLKLKSVGKPLSHSSRPKSNHLQLYTGSEK